MTAGWSVPTNFPSSRNRSGLNSQGSGYTVSSWWQANKFPKICVEERQTSLKMLSLFAKILKGELSTRRPSHGGLAVLLINRSVA